MLWFQGAGVDYSAAEDRKLLSSIWNAGILYGLNITAGVGLSVVVSSGRVVIPDGSGGAYLAYFDTATTVGSLAASSTNTIYATVDLNTGQGVLLRSATAPTNPNVQIGTGVTSTTAVTSTTKGAVATSPVQVISATSITVPGIFTANSAGVNAPKGVRLGGVNATARAYSKAARAADQTAIATGSDVWTTVQYDAASRDVNDYSSAPIHTSTGRFTAPVAGSYHVSGRASFVAATGGNSGLRQSRVAVYSSTDVLLQSVLCDLKDATGAGGNRVSWEAMVDMPLGSYVQFQVSHSQGSNLSLAGGANLSLIGANYASIRLIQAD